ncbi:MAG: hypothetical protein LBQ73_07705 [Tannerellaceae bacterium]|jgi:hypothetical protein|nr:hypothetical protein [Tannerellaceae bacterium]
MERNITEKVKVELDLITAAVKANCNPVAIYLFGSYAYGTPDRLADRQAILIRVAQKRVNTGTYSYTTGNKALWKLKS